jgi:hypothetical protein
MKNLRWLFPLENCFKFIGLINWSFKSISQIIVLLIATMFFGIHGSNEINNLQVE